MELERWNSLLEKVESKPRKKKEIKHIKVESDPEPFWRRDKIRLSSSGARLGKDQYC